MILFKKGDYAMGDNGDFTNLTNRVNKETTNKKIGCGSIILVLIGIVIIIFICIGIQEALEIRDSYRSGVSSSSSNIYRITRETGFYKYSYSEDYSETLRTGTKIKPANNSSHLSCLTEDFDGISITSCLVEIISTGKTGWVLKNAIRN